MERLDALSPDLRRELLLVLTSPSRVRADLIRQLHEHGKGWWVDLFIELEADPVLRAELVIRLRELDEPGA